MNEVYIDESSFRRRYHYNKQDLLGEGGFAQVYKAFDNQFQENVALKFYNKGEQGRYDVLNEILKGRGFAHKNIIRVHDAFTVKFETGVTSAFLQVGVLEFANGGNLRDFVKSRPSEEVFDDVIRGVLSGLHYLHSDKAIIHRDFTPGNILMVIDDGKWIPRIADFGISKKVDSKPALDSNQATQLLGKIEYMAPEQFNTHKFAIGGKINTNVDLWSFGIVLYEIFSNRKPFLVDDQNVMSTIQSICESPLPNLDDIQSPYKEMIQACLIKDANKRPRSASELIEMLDTKKKTFQLGEAKTQPVSLPTATRKMETKKSPYKRIAMMFAGCAIAIIASFLFFFGNQPKPRVAETETIDSVSNPDKPSDPTIIHASDTVDIKAKINKLIADGNHHMIKSNFALASKAYKEALALDPNNDPVKQRLAESDLKNKINKLINDGNRYLRANSTELAKKKFEEALALAPGNPVARRKLNDIENVPEKDPHPVAPDTPANEHSLTSHSIHAYIKLLGITQETSQTVVKIDLKPGSDVRIFPPYSKGAYYITYRDSFDTVVKLPLVKVEGIRTDDAVTLSASKVVHLVFAKLPEDIEQFDLIEGDDQIDELQDYWNFYEVKIKKR